MEGNSKLPFNTILFHYKSNLCCCHCHCTLTRSVAMPICHIALYSLVLLPWAHACLSYLDVPCFLKEWWPSEITLNVSYREWIVPEDIAVALLERHIGYIFLNLCIVRCFGSLFILLKQCCCGRSAETEWHGERVCDPCLIVGIVAFASRKVRTSMLLFLIGICTYFMLGFSR